jgi:hypothetical protein
MAYATPSATARSALTTTLNISGSTSLASTGAIATGATIVVAGTVWNFENAATWISGVTDNKGNSYVVTHRENVADNNAMSFFAEAVNVTGGADVTVTLTFGTPNGWNSVQMLLIEVGNVSPAPKDKLTTSFPALGVTTAATTTGTLSQADEIAIAVISGFGDSITTPSGWTQLATANQVTGDNPAGAVWIGYDAVTATTALVPTWGHDSAAMATILRTYKAAETDGKRLRVLFDASKLTTDDTGITALVWRGNPTTVYALEFTGLAGDATAGELRITDGTTGWPTNMAVGETVNVLAYNATDTSGLVSCTVETY